MRVHTNDVGYMHCISTAHLCDVIKARALWKYNELVLTNRGAYISLNILLWNFFENLKSSWSFQKKFSKLEVF